ncbi:basic form of pathogenesis-related protein 1-like [Ipomoea triloba]|uniref:basic form of pathogenesis-related protein 1-like n=1 Tax=Ipomoea triloba TaxID=35885 RepID=UPI00125E4FBF|nr:basic form of pathogenesis-related protein 1-like [Ipomoea triloba]
MGLLFFMITIAMSTFHLSGAQYAAYDYVNPHNDARYNVNVTFLAWDEDLESYAQGYARALSPVDCDLIYDGGSYGVNLAKAYPDLDAAGAVKMWVDQKANYDYDSNTCVDGGEECRRYTQVVWGSSTRLGCARARCINGWRLIACLYYPAGNDQERPY